MGDKIINDNVHGHINIPKICMLIVDTPQFQRLRFIKQCGFGYLVYPTCTHTRFEHSLGVCYLAGQMVDWLNKNSKVKIDEREKLLLQIAGLIHDLGHGPYSHLWDTFLKKIGTISTHEQRSCEIFKSFFEDLRTFNLNNNQGSFTLEELNFLETFNENDYEFISDVIHGICQTSKKYLYQIISNKKNEIDIDKWDYLARDALQYNIKNSFDFKRIMVNCRINDDNEIVYRQKNEIDLREMFNARQLNYLRGYYHPITIIYEREFVKILILAYSQKIGIPSNKEPIKLNETDPEKFIQLTDHIIWDLYRNDFTRERIENILHRKQHKNLKKNLRKEIENSRKVTLSNFDEIKKNIIFYG